MWPVINILLFIALLKIITDKLFYLPEYAENICDKEFAVLFSELDKNAKYIECAGNTGDDSSIDEEIDRLLAEINADMSSNIDNLLDINKAIVSIAFITSVSDSHLDKREAIVITDYFRAKCVKFQDPKRLKKEINDTLIKLLEGRKLKNIDFKDMLQTSCMTLLKVGDKCDAQEAYELSVRVITADRKVNGAEWCVLRRLAEMLEIPLCITKEIQDRYFAISMFSKNSEEALLGILPGLTKDEKVQFLNKEYQKWRGRVNHSDEKVRAEAELRIQAITRARKQLESELQNV